MSAAVKNAFDPRGKTFKQRLEAFLADARTTHGIAIRVDKGRTPEWQQKHHVAHMFLYNAYKTTKPRNTAPGERTIAWTHFSDPTVEWVGGKWEDFLRTKNGSVPVKEGRRWKKGAEPDRNATVEHVKRMLLLAGIGNNGQAMVSAGLSPCAEPCRCGAGRSKHLSDGAADLDSRDLLRLTSALAKANAGTLDDYLRTFGLHRPLLNHPSSPEKWHVEATLP